MNNCTMIYFDILPGISNKLNSGKLVDSLEILEQMYSTIESKDLAECSKCEH